MKLANKWTSDLLGKDKQKSEAAAIHIINTPDIEAWQCLLENSEYIFSFIKEKAIKNIVKQINENNYKNIFEFFKFYNSEFDDYLIEKFSKFCNEELNWQLTELLKNGSDDEKTYAAKYFCYVKHNSAIDELFNLLKSNNQSAKENAAQALGYMEDETTYKYLLEKLNSNDDWAKVEASQLLTCYGNKYALLPMLKAMSSSSMAEHIAGEIATLEEIDKLLVSTNPEVKLYSIEVLDNIISAIPEIWPLNTIIDFKIFESVERLINLSIENKNNSLSGKYAQILLKIKSRMNLFASDTQYTFDQEKHVINEVNEICNLINSIEEDFWNYQSELLYKELYSDDAKNILSSLNIIKEIKPANALPHVLELVYENQHNELLLCESLLTISELGGLNQIYDSECLINSIKDQNLQALIRNAFINSK